MKLRIIVAVLVILSGVSLVAPADTPVEVWQYEVLSNLYAPPMVADVVGTLEMEIIISDSEARRIRCIDADGNQVWECDGGWKKRLISTAALSADNLLAIANGDGLLTCINAADGAVLWKKDIGAVEWGGALWATLDAAQAPCVVVGTEHDGVIAVNKDGSKRRRLKANAVTPPLHIRGPLAAAVTTRTPIMRRHCAMRCLPARRRCL